MYSDIVNDLLRQVVKSASEQLVREMPNSAIDDQDTRRIKREIMSLALSKLASAQSMIDMSILELLWIVKFDMLYAPEHESLYEWVDMYQETIGLSKDYLRQIVNIVETILVRVAEWEYENRTTTVTVKDLLGAGSISKLHAIAPFFNNGKDTVKDDDGNDIPLTDDIRRELLEDVTTMSRSKLEHKRDKLQGNKRTITLTYEIEMHDDKFTITFRNLSSDQVAYLEKILGSAAEVQWT